MQEERSQHRNRAKAMALLRARILDGGTQRANDQRAPGPALPGRFRRPLATHPHLQFSAGRVADHRVNLTLYSLDRFMEGEGLDAVIDALAADRQATLLAEQAEQP